jgi:hypothetical protein
LEKENTRQLPTTGCLRFSLNVLASLTHFKYT